MKRQTWNLRNSIYLAVFISAICVPTVLATTLIGIRVKNGFIIAADSKATYKGPGNRGPATVCKIVQSGPLYFAVAGLVADRDRGFMPEKIVASNFSSSDSLARNMERIEQAISNSLKVEMKRLKAEDPDNFASNQRPGADILSIIVGEMVNETAQMSGRGFKYVDESTPIAITRLSCPGNCTNDAFFFFAGESDVAQKALNTMFSDGTVHNPVTDARKLVELEIQASPDTVGPPITILQVDKNGPSWISNDSGCPTVLTPN
jgi:hypothetical protein